MLVAAWVALGMEAGLRDAMQAGNSPVAPSFVLILGVFVATWARRGAALWACVLLGAASDLLTNVPAPGGETVTVLGPGALGLLAAGYTTHTLRAWMFRRNAVAVAFMCVVGGCVSAAVSVSLLKLRGAYDTIELSSATRELGWRAGSALYSAAVALLLVPVLTFIKPVFGFPAVGRGGRER